MNENTLNRLFDEARSKRVETSVRDVHQWVGLLGAGGLLAGMLLNLKLLLTKKLLLMTFITSLLTATVGITVYVAVHMTEPMVPQPGLLQQEKLALTDTNDSTAVQAEPQDTLKPADSVLLAPIVPVAPITPPVPPVFDAARLPTLSPLPGLPVLPARPEAPVVVLSIPPPPQLPGKPEVRHVAVGSFDKIELSGALHVLLIQGETTDVRIESQGDCETNAVQVKNERNTLRISGGSSENCGVMVYVTCNSLSKIVLSGATALDSQAQLKFDDLSIECGGAASVNLDLETERLDLVLEDAGAMELKGKTIELKINASGAASFDGAAFGADRIDVKSSDASNVVITVNKKLKADASDTASIRYKGAPSEITKEISGFAVIAEY